MQALSHKLIRLLGHRRLPAAVIALSTALVLPSLGAGLISDDFIHRFRVHADEVFPGFPLKPLDLFVFSSGNPAQRRLLMDEGVFSWWTAEGFKLAFWRPIASATHLLDQVLWGRSPMLMHAHSVLWFVALLLAVAAVYRRFQGGWVAGLALLLYAVDDARGFTVGFIANRNALMGAALGLLALAAHDRCRRDGWAPGRWASPLLLGLGLLAGEIALGVAGYLLAYALFLDRGPLKRRALSLVPHALVCLVWFALYRALGYGAHASGIYLDPAGDTGAYLGALAERLPVLLLGQLALPPSDLFFMLPDHLAPALVALALAVVFLAALLTWPLLRRLPEARFWALGAVLSCLPVCATFSSDRLLVLPGVGAMGLLAILLASRLDREVAPGVGRAWRVAASSAAVLLVLIHLVLAPALLPLRSMTVKTLRSMFDQVDHSIPRAPSISQQTLVVVNAPSDGLVCYFPMTRQALGEPRPGRLRLLSSGVAELHIARLDGRTLSLEPGAGFLRSRPERMVRGLQQPFVQGDTVTLKGLQILVREVTPDGRPARVEFRFDVPLEDPSLRWMHWNHGSLAPYTPPAVGRSHTLPTVDLLADLLAGERGQ